MRFFLAVLALLALCLPRPCSGGEEAAREWTAFAGFQEEGESAKLELRDELIAANLASLAALEKGDRRGRQGGDGRAGLGKG